MNTIGDKTLSVTLYEFLFNMHKINILKSRWISNVKNILDLAGISNIWLCQFDFNINRKWLSQKIEKCYRGME